MADVLLRGIDREAGLRIAVAVTTDLVREAARRHGAEGLVACALGRALTASVLLATLTKGRERVTVQLEGSGSLGGIVVDANHEGAVRGYLARSASGAACIGRGRVVEVLGRDGVVNVLRDLGLKERYQGQVALTTGEIDEDVEHYLRTSEQIPSALGCDVLIEDGKVIAAAGLLVQALPRALDGGDDEEDERPEAVLRSMQHALRIGAIWDVLRSETLDAEAIAERIYLRPVEFLDRRPLRFECRCSRERVEESLTLLSSVDLDEMIAEEGAAEVICNFCNERYVVDRDRLEAVRELVARGPRGRN